MKKNLLLLAGATMLFAACSQDDLISENENNGNAIGFSTITTRAAETTTGTMTDFRVWGYYGATSPVAASTTSLYMDVQPEKEVTDNAGYKPFTYSPLKFWPLTGVIDFFAVSPKDAYSDAANTTLTYNVTATDAASHTDLLFARALNKTRPNTATRVQLDFKHALSQIRFEARSAHQSMNFAVSSIELVNVLPNGTVNVASTGTNPWNIPSTMSTAGNGLVWTASGTALDYSFGLASTGSAVTDTTVVYHATNYVDLIAKDNNIATGALMIIPQALTAGTVTDAKGITSIGGLDSAPTGYTYTTLNEGSYIRVTYAAYDAATGTELIPAGTVQVIPIAADFKPGVKYTYQLTLKGILQPIEFEAKVEEWFSNGNTAVEI